MKKVFWGIIAAVCLIVDCSAITAYCYSSSVAASNGDSVSVYSGAAYVLSYSASNTGGQQVTVNVKDAGGNILGGAAATAEETVSAYSSPIKIPNSAGVKGKATVSVEVTPSELAGSVSNIKLSLASDDVLSVVQNNGVLTVRGNIDGTANGSVNIYVLDNAEEYETENTQKVVWQTTLTVAAGSTYSLNADVSQIEKYYSDLTVVIGGLSALGYDFDVTVAEIRYVKTTLKDEMIAKLNTAESLSRVESIMKGGDEDLTNIELLGLNEIEMLRRFSSLDFLYSYLYTNKAEITDEAKLKNLVKQACVFEGLKTEMDNAALAGYITEYAEAISITDSEFTPYTTAYKNKTDAEKAAIVGKMKQAAAVANTIQFKNMFAQETLNYAFNNSSNYTEIIALLSQNQTYLGMSSITALSTELQKQLAEYAKTATDVMTIKDKQAALLASQSGSGSGSSSSGGGGGGGGGGSVSATTFYKSAEAATNAKNQTPSGEKFKDLSAAPWAKEYINKVADKGIMSGYNDGTFKPNAYITRAEFAKIAAMAFLPTTENSKSNFNDIPENDWSYSYVSALYSQGIINGVGNGEFGKNNNISRQDMAVILKKIAEKLGLKAENKKISFADNSSISEYAAEAVEFMSSLGVISGKENNCFVPLGNATRAEAAKVICVLMEIAD